MPWLGKAGMILLKMAGVNTSQTYNTMSSELVRFFGSPTASGKSVTENSIMALTAAWGCVRIISESFGALPWAIYRKVDDKNAVKEDSHPLVELFSVRPNKDQTTVEFRETMATNLCQAGNAYAFRDGLGGYDISLTPQKSSNVQPKVKQGGNTKLAIPDGEKFYSVLDRGQWVDFPREKIWHVKGFGSDGFIGLSPVGVVREAFGAAMAAEEFGARFFGQGGKPSGVVTIPQWLNDDQRAIARENLQQMLGGLTNAHKFALFEGGMKAEPWGDMSLQDMQFLLLRRFNVQEIARIYRIPPHMLADLEKGASYASIEQMSSEFVMFTLMPYFTRFEASFARWLLPVQDQSKYFLRFKYEGLLRADSEARAKFYASALQNGWLNRNEVRGYENLNTVAGLEDYTVQTNLTPADMLAAIAGAQAAAGSKPEPKKESVVIPERKDQPIVLALNVSPPAITFSPVFEGAKVNVAAPDFSQLPAPVVTVGGATNNIEFPKAMKISVDGLEGAGDLLTQGVLANLALGDATIKALESLRSASQQKRKVVYGPNGEVTGIEPV